MHPLDLVEAAPWKRLIFTTYALSLSFVEAVVLDRMVRGGARDALILADPDGIRAGLREQGARRAGRDYELEPVVCTSGVFHPKLSLFFSDADAHMLVSSGNLTFGGWGMNLETTEHIHPSFAAEAFDDAADLFELMSISETIKCGITSRFEHIATDLRRSARGANRRGNFRLLHSVGSSIGEQIANLADGLGGAKRLTIVSPYFDVNGDALTWLSTLLGCDDVALHAHPSGPVRGALGTSWPNTTTARPVCVHDPFGNDGRHLHAKCFEVICSRGRLLMSGSANATRAGLRAGNVEASLIRIQRETLIGWDSDPCDPLTMQLPPDDEDQESEEQRKIGILRAVLDGERICGQVLEPALSGEANLRALSSTGALELGKVTLDTRGMFEVIALDLEMQSWGGARLVLHIEQNGQVAEGFVSMAAATELARRAGSLAPRLLAMLSGTETPEDAAAILTWFKEDVRRLTNTAPAVRSVSEGDAGAPTWVPIEALTEPLLDGPYSSRTAEHGEPAWQRALSMIRLAFSEPRGPWTSGTAQDEQLEDEEKPEDETEREKRFLKDERAKINAMKVFDELLDEMLAERHDGIHAPTALALAHYLTDRIRPNPLVVHGWLRRILNNFSRLSVANDGEIGSVILLAKATDGLANAAGRARPLLLRSGIDPSTLEIELDSVPAFIQILAANWDGSEFLARVRRVKTPGEQVQAFLRAAYEGAPHAGFEELEQLPSWPKLSKVLADPNGTNARVFVVDEPVKACPKCHLVMPVIFQQELRTSGVVSYCHLILCREI